MKVFVVALVITLSAYSIIQFGVPMVRGGTDTKIENIVKIPQTLTGKYRFADDSGWVEISLEDGLFRSYDDCSTTEMYFTVMLVEEDAVLLNVYRMVSYQHDLGFDYDEEVSCYIYLVRDVEGLVRVDIEGITYILERDYMQKPIEPAEFRDHDPEDVLPPLDEEEFTWQKCWEELCPYIGEI